MQNNNQNSGGHSRRDDRHERHAQKHESKDSKRESIRDYTTNVWHKIEGGVAKNKINNLKQEVQGNQQNQNDTFKKRRRRRRRGRGGREGQSPQQAMSSTANLDQNFPQKQHQIQHDQVFTDDQATETAGATEESIFEDADQPEEKQPEQVEKQPEVYPEPEETPSEVEPQVEAPIEIKAQAEVEGHIIEAPAEAPVPAEPEELPPINPFDFGATETAQDESKLPPSNYVQREEPMNPFDIPRDAMPEHEHVKPINPFDLTEQADDAHVVTPVDQGVYEEAVSPKETGESNEFESVTAKESDEEEEDLRKEPEVIEVKASDIQERKIEPVFPDKIENENVPHDEFKEDFWTILEHAGITKQKLITFGIILLILLGVGVFFIFGGMNLFSSSKSSDQKLIKREIPVQEKTEQKVPQPSEARPVSNDQRPYDVISSYIFGLEYQKQGQIEAQPISSIGTISGIDAGLIFGKISNLKQERFVEYVQLLEKMNNIYNVDIYNMLDLAVDRRAALDKYLKDMSNLIDQGGQDLASIQGNLQEFNLQYEASSKQASAYETNFFNQVKNYYGQTAFDNLQSFMDSSAQAVRLKAQYGAENALKNMFVNSLAALKPRYQDILANTEALIKGVKIFDIKGSDINAIIPVK